PFRTPPTRDRRPSPTAPQPAWNSSTRAPSGTQRATCATISSKRGEVRLPEGARREEHLDSPQLLPDRLVPGPAMPRGPGNGVGPCRVSVPPQAVQSRADRALDLASRWLERAGGLSSLATSTTCALAERRSTTTWRERGIPPCGRSAYGETPVRRSAALVTAATSFTGRWWTRQCGVSTTRCDPSWKMPILGEAARPRTARRARCR